MIQHLVAILKETLQLLLYRLEVHSDINHSLLLS